MKRTIILVLFFNIVALCAYAQDTIINPSHSWHYTGVNTAFHPDGKRVLTRDRIGATLWNMETKTIVRNYYNEFLQGTLCMFNRAGTIIFLEGRNGLVHLIDTETGSTIITVGREKTNIKLRAMALDSKEEYLIVTHGYDADVWDIKTGKLVYKLVGANAGDVEAVSFNEERTKAITFSANSVTVWDMQWGESMHTIYGVVGGSLNHKGNRLVSHRTKDTLSIWDINTGTLIRKVSDNSEYDISDVQYNYKGDKIISCGGDKIIRIWDAESGELLASAPFQVRLSNMKLYKNDSVFTAEDEDNTLYMFTMKNGKMISQYKNSAGCLSDYILSDYSHNVALICDKFTDTEKIEIWNTNTNKNVFTIEENHSVFQHVEFCNDGTKVLTYRSTGETKHCIECTIKIWDTQTGKLIHTLQQNEGLYTAVFSPNGAMIAASGDNGQIRLWDVNTGTTVKTLKGHGAFVWNIAFDDKGERIVTSSYDRSAKVWNIVTGELIHDLKDHSDWVWTATFNNKGDRIITGGDDKKAIIWDAQSGKALFTYRSPEEVRSIHCDNTGNRVAITSLDGVTIIVNVYTGTVETTIAEGNYWNAKSSFSPDGKKIVTLAWDNTAKVYDSYSGELLYVLRGQTDVLRYANFNHKGDRIITNSLDGKILVWNANDGTQLATLVKAHGTQGQAKFSPDDKLVAGTGSALKFWNVENTPVYIDEERTNVSKTEYLFPNPTSGTITVQTETDTPYSYLIINQLGETVQSGEVEESGYSHQVSVSILPSGTYIFISRTTGIINKQMFSVIK